MSPKNKPTRPVDIYVRVSRVGGRDVEAEGGTAADQEKRCRAQLEADGLEAGEVWTDLDESGGKVSRPAFDRALARIESGQSGGLIVFNLRRFGRTTSGVLDGIRWIEEQGGTFISCSEKLDTSTPMGRFALTLFAGLGTLELEERTEQFARSRANAVASGIHITPTLPSGYSRDPDTRRLVPNSAAPAILAAFKLRGNGGSWTEVARLLTEQGVVITHGPRKGSHVWTATAATRVLANRVYLGEARSGTYVEKDAHPAIVGPGLFARVQGRLSTKGDYADPDRERALLAGLARCANCGRSLTRDSTRRAGKVYPFYRCKNQLCTSRVAISATRLEEHVLSEVIAKGSLSFEGTPPGDDSAYQAALARVEDATAALDEFAASWRAQGISPATAASLAAPLELERDEAVAELNAIPTHSVISDELQDRLRAEGLSGPGLAALYGGLSHDGRRKLLALLVAGVVVNRGRADVAERAQVTVTSVV
jgi:DNA invertase Pin-like site-specific DNA recombinase